MKSQGKHSLKSKTVIRNTSSHDTDIGISGKFTMINMLKSLIKKVDNMQEQTIDFCREMETLRKKKQLRMLEIKNLKQMKNIFKDFINKLNTTKDIISYLDNELIKIKPNEI